MTAGSGRAPFACGNIWHRGNSQMSARLQGVTMLKILACVALAGACSSPSDPISPDAPLSPDAATSATISLRTTAFEQPASAETYHCWYFKPATPPGAAITAFHPITSAGVHHLALFFDAGGSVQPDGPCDSFGPWSLLWGAGVGTNDAVLPSGIALPARSDGVYVLQVHILNASDQAIAIRAGVDMTLSASSYTRAGVFLMGNTHFTVPGYAQNLRVTTDCSGKLPDAAQLVGLFPHMHRLGAEFQVDLVSGGDHHGIYDEPWRFDAQTLALFAPEPAVRSSDTIEMRCIYDNPTATAVSFGPSTSDEMCFGAFYYTPATTDEIDCIR
jgi:hypothetical protein